MTFAVNNERTQSGQTSENEAQHNQELYSEGDELNEALGKAALIFRHFNGALGHQGDVGEEDEEFDSTNPSSHVVSEEEPENAKKSNKKIKRMGIFSGAGGVTGAAIGAGSLLLLSPPVAVIVIVGGGVVGLGIGLGAAKVTEKKQ